MISFKSRAGFTLLEVLVASAVLMVALLGIASTAASLLQRSSNPSKLETAAILANERLNYFRSQPDPYRAAGGTHYAPPERRGQAEDNADPALNNNFNGRQELFVREFLYSEIENRFRSSLEGDTGRANQQRDGEDMLVEHQIIDADDPDTVAARNEIPPIPLPPNTTIKLRVFPNVDGGVDMADERAVIAGRGDVVFIAAPRANDNIRNDSNLDKSIAFVREVWVQTNHPNFASIAAPAILETRPTVQNNLPPYTVAVTVKVYARDPRTVKLDTGRSTRDSDGNGPGYDFNRPLSTMVGYFGLRRALR